MSIKVTVNSVPKTRVSINNQKRETIRTVGISAPKIVNRLEDLLDVDASNADNNETLVYDATTGKYVVREIPIINGGDF
jgi:hypothetical protein